MPTISHLLPKYLVRKQPAQELHRPRTAPSVPELLTLRKQLTEGQRHIPLSSQSATSTASLYRMYEYLVTGYTIGLRSEIEFFFNQPSWPVSAIPDPRDPDPQRYAILAGLPHYLVKAFNRLIERGLPRGSPAIIMGPAAEESLRKQPVVLETEPEWTKSVKRLEENLVIPDRDGNEAAEEARSERFCELGVIVEEPHVLFV